ncbi:MAG: SUMF1/EgtB/PvdO family nonheme iron enzyme [Rhodoferax sp.]|nr:SUMF1/EgtB/PvdO family nonheme iron enzyme [Rhodoferax sp.]
MSAFTTLCPGCFAEKGNASTCPHCGYDESQKRGPLVLPHRTLLHHGQYLIGKVLGKPGGFGITYLAFDTKLETNVAIKEYLPRDLAGRDGDHATISAHSAEDADHFRYGLTQFLQEARTLARFDHANIVRVRNFFEENGTGYLVMDYYDGITLADYLAQQPQGKLTEKTAVDILMPILDGLREVHAKNFLHRDIKPQNIYLTTGNRAILLDFGAARQAMSERSRSLSVVLSEGYAPYEQYHSRGEQGPWTDIYASSAVLYHMVTGEAPPPATERVAKDELDIGALGCSATLANALRLGLAVDHRKRPQTMADFQALLLTGSVPGRDPPMVRTSLPSAHLASEAPPTQTPSPVASSQSKRGWVVVVVSLLAGGWWLISGTPDQRAASVPAPAQALVGRTLPRDCADCPEIVVIPAGTFTMGSSVKEQSEVNSAGLPKEITDRESPQHSVSIRSFALGKTEVTRGQFAAFVAASGHSAGNSCWVWTGREFADTPDRHWRNPGFAQSDNDPVACVNWDDAQAYLRWLAQKTGKPYRLPSEAEWEYACRGGTNQTYCGSDTLDSVAVYGSKTGDRTLPVAGKQANARGLYDMSGNVWEWTQDCWNVNYQGSAPSGGSAWTTGDCGQRVLRGGAWNVGAAGNRAAIRNRIATSSRYSVNGFRLARMIQ